MNRCMAQAQLGTIAIQMLVIGTRARQQKGGREGEGERGREGEGGTSVEQVRAVGQKQKGRKGEVDFHGFGQRLFDAKIVQGSEGVSRIGKGRGKKEKHLSI